MQQTKNIFDSQVSKPANEDNVFAEFLVNKGLYESIDINEDNFNDLINLIGGNVKLNIYCPECGEKRVFKGQKINHCKYDSMAGGLNNIGLANEIVSHQEFNKLAGTKTPHIVTNNDYKKEWSWKSNTYFEETRIMIFKFLCAMDDEHHLDYVVVTTENKFIKIGQYPSFADLSMPDLNQYRKVMNKNDERELKRAVGLKAHGIGIGSFVYLRRVFERIIMQAGQKAINEGNINETDFKSAHIENKIKMLVDYLPKIIVDNKIFYKIVSKGIHELSEEECLDYFQVLYSFILMTLKDWQKKLDDYNEERNIATSLQNIASKVK